MKIAFVIDSWNGGNGAVVATKRVVKELVARGHEITLVSTGQHEGDFTFYEVPGFYLPGVRESLEKMEFLFGKGKGALLTPCRFHVQLLRRTYRPGNMLHVVGYFLFLYT